VLPLVPVYLGHMVNVSSPRPGVRERASTLLHAATFVGGFSVVFIAFWTSIGALGFFAIENARYMREAAGAVLIFMGLHLIGVINIPFMERQYNLNLEAKRPGYPRSFLLGVTFAAGWTPCIGPVLGSIIGLALTDGSVPNLALLLVGYSAGLGVPFLGVALAADPISRWMKRQRRVRALVPAASGLLVVAVGVLMLTNSLIQMNQFFNFGRYS
jgi:cytochrome c-type biogenesis protein